MSSADVPTQHFHGVRFAPPAEFELVETMLSFRAPNKEELRDPRLLHRQVSVRPNVIVHRKQAKPGVALVDLVGTALAEFIRTMVQLENVQKSEFAFQDGSNGFLIRFDYPATKDKTLRQYHAFRLDDGILTTLALTADAVTVASSEEDEQMYLQSLASLVADTAA